MKREILINASPRETRVAILEDEQLVELMIDRPDNRRMVGDIYLGKVEAVLPGIQAAFVDIGTEKSAFLHASDLVFPESDEDADDEPEDDASDDEDESAGGGRRKRVKAPPIQDLLKRGQDVIVQVSKEPISTKGPRVTAQVSLAGRFLVYMPFASRVGVSRKIGERAERQRLREQMQGVLPADSGGVIVRTVGEDVTQDTFRRELTTLMTSWKKIQRKTRFLRAPALVHRETSLTRGLTRDLFSTKVDSLVVDSKQVYNEIAEYLKGIAPELIERVKLYDEQVPIFDKADIESEIRDLFKRRCDLPSGGYLIIEQTEALVSVDVNSGRYTGKRDPEKTILKTNTEAALRSPVGRISDHRADGGARLGRRELGALHGEEGSREDHLQDEHGGCAGAGPPASFARHRRHHRLRLHRHGDEGESRQGAAGAAYESLARPGADESIRRQ